MFITMQLMSILLSILILLLLNVEVGVYEDIEDGLVFDVDTLVDVEFCRC